MEYVFIWQAKRDQSIIPNSTKPSDLDKKTTLPIINHTQITQNITKTTSIINTTEKINVTNWNKLIISLSASFLMVMLCICCSYYIFVYLIHYLNTTLDIKQDTSELNRLSVATSTCSDDIQLYNKTNEQRRSSTDSVELFRY